MIRWQLLLTYTAVLAVALAPGCSRDSADPPGEDELKRMISRAASIPVETFEMIANGPIVARSALCYSPDQPLTLMMLGATFLEVEREIEVRLPASSGPALLSSAPQEIVINIRRNGQIVIRGHRLDKQGLRKLLVSEAAENPNRKVVIRCDADVAWKHPADVFTLCGDAGISYANIAFMLPASDLRPKEVDAPPPLLAPSDLPDVAPPDFAPPADVAPAPEAPADKLAATKQLGDFRALTGGGIGRPEDLYRALYGRGRPPAKDAGQYASVIWPEYITACTRHVTGRTIAGKVSFRAEGVYEGAVEYTARRGPDGWRVVEFHLPKWGLRTTLGADGRWHGWSRVGPDRPLDIRPRVKRDVQPKGRESAKPYEAAPPLGTAPPQVIINIQADGTMSVAGQSMSRSQIAEMLTRIARDDPQRHVLVRADKRALHKHFAWVVAEARRCGIAEVRIGYIVAPSVPPGKPGKSLPPGKPVKDKSDPNGIPRDPSGLGLSEEVE